FSFYIAIGATVGLILLMKEVNVMLFTNELGTNSLRVLALSILMTAISITVISILQSIGKMKLSALYILFAVGVKLLLNIVLVPLLGITGSAVATSGSLFFLSVLVCRLLQKELAHLRLFQSIKWKGLIIATVTMTLYLLVMKGMASF